MSLPWPPDLLSASQEAARGTTLRTLARIYKELPSTICDRRGHCCGLLPPVQPIEIIAWLIWFLNQPPETRAAEASRLVEHFLLNACERRACPWARPGSCAIYERRFFGCRTYGLWTPAIYGQRQAQSRAAKETVVAAWAGLGIVLPDAVLAPSPAYCDEVKPAPGENRPTDDLALTHLEERLAALDPDLPWLDACEGDLSHALARLALGDQGCLRAKMEITRTTLNGHDDLAALLLAQAIQTTEEWAAPPPEAA